MSKILLYFYVILPLLFFGIPVIVADKIGDVSFHYYKTIYTDHSILLSVWIYYLIFGLIIYLLTKIIDCEISLVKSRFGNSLIMFSALCFVAPFSYSRIVLLPLLIILTSRYELNRWTKLVLLSIGMVILLFQGQRFFIIFAFLLFFKRRLAQMKISHMFLYTLLGIFLLVFVLEPLKRGSINSQYAYNLVGLVQHLQPIYVANYVGLNVDYSVQLFLIESLPLVKSIFHQQGSVELLGNLILPEMLIQSGARVGSTSTVFFKPFIFLTSCIFVISFFLLVRRLKSQLLYASVFNYLFLFGPYFIRRSFTSYLIDLLIIVFILIVLRPVFIAKKS